MGVWLSRYFNTSHPVADMNHIRPSQKSHATWSLLFYLWECRPREVETPHPGHTAFPDWLHIHHFSRETWRCLVSEVHKRLPTGEAEHSGQASRS
jgi:hypothetical protein